MPSAGSDYQTGDDAQEERLPVVTPDSAAVEENDDAHSGSEYGEDDRSGKRWK